MELIGECFRVPAGSTPGSRKGLGVSPCFIIVIDEIDHFSKNLDKNRIFQKFLFCLLNNKLNLKFLIIGIANSVELFKGDLNIQAEYLNSQRTAGQNIGGGNDQPKASTS